MLKTVHPRQSCRDLGSVRSVAHRSLRNGSLNGCLGSSFSGLSGRENYGACRPQILAREEVGVYVQKGS